MRFPSTMRRASMALMVASSACATGTPPSLLSSPTVSTSSRYVLTSSEIAAVDVNNALEAVRRLRPDLLLRRANVITEDPYQGAPVLYVDNVFQGKLDLLSTIPAHVVKEIRYHAATAAMNEFGRFYAGGVIAVVTRPAE